MAKLPSELPETVANDEMLARFLTSSRHYNSVGVKPGAFLPNPHDGKTSVFRHEEEPRHALWKIGQSVVGAGARTLHGATFLRAKDIRATTLDVEAHEPPERHGNIIKWPSVPSDLALQKAKQKELAIVLAGMATMRKTP